MNRTLPCAGSSTRPLPQGHSPPITLNRLLVTAGSPVDQHTLAAADVGAEALEKDQPCGVGDAEVLDHQAPAPGLAQMNARPVRWRISASRRCMSS